MIGRVPILAANLMSPFVLDDLSGGAAAPAYAFQHALSFVGTPLFLGGVIGLYARQAPAKL